MIMKSQMEETWLEWEDGYYPFKKMPCRWILFRPYTQVGRFSSHPDKYNPGAFKSESLFYGQARSSLYLIITFHQA